MAPFVIVFVLFIEALSEVSDDPWAPTPQLGVTADVTVDDVPFSDFTMISDCKRRKSFSILIMNETSVGCRDALACCCLNFFLFSKCMQRVYSVYLISLFGFH